jgi:hypothetical protein
MKLKMKDAIYLKYSVFNIVMELSCGILIFNSQDSGVPRNTI